MNTPDLLQAMAYGAFGFLIVSAVAVRIAILRLRRLVPVEHDTLRGNHRD